MSLAVSFRIMGTDLDPSEVTEMLGVAPDKSHRAGDPIGTVFSRSAADFSEGLWALESSVGEAESLERHIASIISRLEGASDKLSKLKWRGYRVDVFVGIFEIDNNVGLELSSDTLRAIAGLSASLNLDLYAS